MKKKNSLENFSEPFNTACQNLATILFTSNGSQLVAEIQRADSAKKNLPPFSTQFSSQFEFLERVRSYTQLLYTPYNSNRASIRFNEEESSVNSLFLEAKVLLIRGNKCERLETICKKLLATKSLSFTAIASVYDIMIQAGFVDEGSERQIEANLISAASDKIDEPRYLKLLQARFYIYYGHYKKASDLIDTLEVKINSKSKSIKLELMIEHAHSKIMLGSIEDAEKIVKELGNVLKDAGDAYINELLKRDLHYCEALIHLHKRPRALDSLNLAKRSLKMIPEEIAINSLKVQTLLAEISLVSAKTSNQLVEFEQITKNITRLNPEKANFYNAVLSIRQENTIPNYVKDIKKFAERALDLGLNDICEYACANAQTYGILAKEIVTSLTNHNRSTKETKSWFDQFTPDPEMIIKACTKRFVADMPYNQESYNYSSARNPYAFLASRVNSGSIGK